MFFIAHYKTAENSPRRFLRTLNESVLTIRIAALVLAYKLYPESEDPGYTTQRSGYKMTSSGLPQFETSAAYYLTVD